MDFTPPGESTDRKIGSNFSRSRQWKINNNIIILFLRKPNEPSSGVHRGADLIVWSSHERTAVVIDCFPICCLEIVLQYFGSQASIILLIFIIMIFIPKHAFDFERLHL